MDLEEIICKANEHSFGVFIRERRESLGKTVRSFAKDLGITPAYLSDIEKGNRYAPKAKLELMFQLLELPKDQKHLFMDLASLTRGEFEDINPYLGETLLARMALRKAKENGISDEKWKEIIKLMDNSDNSK